MSTTTASQPTSTAIVPGVVNEIIEALRSHQVVPYIGPGMLDLVPQAPVPTTPEALVALLTAKVTVPHKIRNRLTQAAQYIENFKHRKSLVQQMDLAFTAVPTPSPFHLWLAGMKPPLVVESWWDDTMLQAMAQVNGPQDWGQAQGLSQSEHFGTWSACYDSAGKLAEAPSASWHTLLYRPIGGHGPAGNYLVSDTDYVEVLTEIDIQTPIPAEVQALRTGRHFLFMGCRFNDQLTRTFARQIMKRSSAKHWAVMPNEPTRMEARFLEEYQVTRIPMALPEFSEALMRA
jgi:hypothetical protein